MKDSAEAFVLVVEVVQDFVDQFCSFYLIGFFVDRFPAVGNSDLLKGNKPKSEEIIPILEKIPEKQRHSVKEITLDMAGSMSLIVKQCFLQATRVRFHVQQLAMMHCRKCV